MRALFARLRAQGRWLVVLDNAASQDAVRPWVPAPALCYSLRCQ